MNKTMNNTILFTSSLAKRIYDLENEESGRISDPTAQSFQIFRKYEMIPDEQFDLYLEISLLNGADSYITFSNVPQETYQFAVQFYDENGDIITEDESSIYTPESITVMNVPTPGSEEMAYGLNDVYTYRLKIINVYHNKPSGAVTWRAYFRTINDTHGSTELGSIYALVSSQSLYKMIVAS
jgi:hypothetical protein